MKTGDRWLKFFADIPVGASIAMGLNLALAYPPLDVRFPMNGVLVGYEVQRGGVSICFVECPH